MPIPIPRRNQKVAVPCGEEEARRSLPNDELMTQAIDEVYFTLLRNFKGDLLRPGGDRHDEARTIWNGIVARSPGLIVRCDGVSGVQAAVRAESAANVLTAIRCGGHSLAGFSTCEGGMVIDLSRNALGER